MHAALLAYTYMLRVTDGDGNPSQPVGLRGLLAGHLRGLHAAAACVYTRKGLVYVSRVGRVPRVAR